MSVLLDHILAELVRELIRSERLVLVEGADPDALVAELRARMAEAPAFSQAGAVLGQALVESPLVDDLYASDADILATLSEVGR